MRFHNFKGFIVLWLGQFVSIFGTALTRFALTVWIYQETGSATALSTGAFFAMAPLFFFMPLGGVLADRLNRKKIMIAADMLGGFSTIVLLSLYLSGNLVIWHIYLTNAILSAAEAFQYPSFVSSTGMIVPKKHLGRANGMRDLAASASRIFAPLAAAALLAVIDIDTIMIIDVITFAVAILTLSVVVIPQPQKSEGRAEAQTNLISDITYGFRFIWKRPGLLGLQSIFMGINFVYTMTSILIPAMILARTNNNEIILGSLQSVMSFGALAGGLLISIWGGPKRKIVAVLGCQILTALLGRVWFGLGHDLLTWLPGAFWIYFFIPISNGSTAAIWMAKTPKGVQGRVMSTRRFIAQVSGPLAALAAGPLAEKVFEPAMMPDGKLASLLGNFVGVGPGAGISLMISLAGLVGLLLTSLVYFIPIVWNVETLLPDHIGDSPSKSPSKKVDSSHSQGKRKPSPAI